MSGWTREGATTWGNKVVRFLTSDCVRMDTVVAAPTGGKPLGRVLTFPQYVQQSFAPHSLSCSPITITTHALRAPAQSQPSNCKLTLEAAPLVKRARPACVVWQCCLFAWRLARLNPGSQKGDLLSHVRKHGDTNQLEYPLSAPYRGQTRPSPTGQKSVEILVILPIAGYQPYCTVGVCDTGYPHGFH